MPVLCSDRTQMRFFDTGVQVTADAPGYLRPFKEMYARFEEKDFRSSSNLTVSIQTISDNPSKQAILKINGQACRIDRSEVVEGNVYEMILRQIVSSVKSHVLIHAGAVTINGNGIILAGDSCHGKTTLVLELVRRGFCFLSDEMAALGRSDRRLYPFPRSLRIRPKTLSFTRFPAAAKSATQWLNKLILDIEQIKPNCMGNSEPITHIIILKDGDKADLDSPVTKIFEVDHLDDLLIASVKRIKGVVEVHLASDGIRNFLHVTAMPINTVRLRIEQVCNQFNVRIIETLEPDEKKPDFKSTVVLHPISKSQAVCELLKKFQGGHYSALLKDDCRSSAARLFLEVSRLISDAKCYQLQVGPLDDMANLICNITRA